MCDITCSAVALNNKRHQFILDTKMLVLVFVDQRKPRDEQIDPVTCLSNSRFYDFNVHILCAIKSVIPVQ